MRHIEMVHGDCTPRNNYINIQLLSVIALSPWFVAALDQLLKERRDIWLGTQRPAEPVLSTGTTELDQWLPTHGWPCSQLIELLPTALGSGELQILLPVLAEQTQQAKPVLLIAPPLIPCPQGLIQAGVDLKHLIIVRSTNNTLWAAEKALKSGLCGTLIIWPNANEMSAVAIRRLQLAGEQGPAPVFLIHRYTHHSAAGRYAIRLKIEPGPKITLVSATNVEPINQDHHSIALTALN